MIKGTIVELLLSTNRVGMDELLRYMDESGFYSAPCSGAYHLAEEGGLSKHSLNVYRTMLDLNQSLKADIPLDTIILVSILHDLGKMGDYGKPNYVENFVRSKTKNKETGEYDMVRSAAKPYETNKELLYVDHEVRSIAIAERFITLTEEEERAILLHNGLYGVFGYQLKTAKQTPLELILHWSDMWASRIIEEEAD